jgi:nitrate reductase gamma subunit
MNPALPAAADLALFVALPYTALVLFLVVSIQRYRSRPFTYSSLSSQFLENRVHFWSLVPFHYGLLGVLALHALATLVPSGLLLFARVPLRLYLLEATGFTLGLLALLGFAGALLRRFSSLKVTVVTSPADLALFALLLFQIVTGLFVALLRPWGYAWFSAVLAPYLWSLAKLSPDMGGVSALPWLVQLHVANAFLITAIFPFTRLVHLIVAPLPYLWRRPQVVRWYRRPAEGGAKP